MSKEPIIGAVDVTKVDHSQKDYRCPADAPNAGKSSDASVSEPGTALHLSSVGLGAILSALTQINRSLKNIEAQQELMIQLLEGEQDEEGPEIPIRDISGRPIQ